MNNIYTRYYFSIALSLVGVAVAWLGTTTSQVVMWIGFGIIAVSVILSLTVRCPRCGKRLAGKGHLALPHYCPNCGEKI